LGCFLGGEIRLARGAGPSFSFVNFEAQSGKRVKREKLALKMPVCRRKETRIEAEVELRAVG